MTRKPGRARRVALNVLGALVLLAAGAAGATVALTRGWVPWTGVGAAPAETAGQTGTVGTPAGQPAAAGAPEQVGGGAEPAGHSEFVEVLLTPEQVDQAGIRTAKATTAVARGTVQVPGTVTPNAYAEVRVTPLVGGLVTGVRAELGAFVRRGAPLATVFSAELAEAQTRFLSMGAMLEAERLRLDRARQLVEIGAASRQELEEATAAATARGTEVEAARQRLALLGLTREQVAALRRPEQIVADVDVPAPIDGTVTARAANVGQVVGQGQELFVVTDLSTVWVVGDLYEQDFPTVRVGSRATVMTTAYPDLALRGRVTYIDPRVDAATRTAKARVEVPNPDGRLRLGMYATLTFGARATGGGVLVPRAAVQNLGNRQVVYVPDPSEPGRYLERPVKVGASRGNAYQILSGLKAGEEVVTEGSFFLRAERLRNEPLS